MRPDVVEELYERGYRTEIFPMDCPENPRDWENLCKLVGNHHRYHIGDEDLDMSMEDMKAYILERDDVLHIEPVYMYDHGGIALSTSPFRCPWDSGQVGYIYVTYSRYAEITGMSIEAIKKDMTNVIKRCRYYMSSELEAYQQYINGEVYAYVTSKDGHMVDSGAGYFGTDWIANGLNDAVRGAIDEDIINIESQKPTKEELKGYIDLDCNECPCESCGMVGGCEHCPEVCVKVHELLNPIH